MQKRFKYLISFLLILSIEICIGLFVRDNFVRPYVGDMLVTVLLCCLSRTLFPDFSPAPAVFLFSASVEGLQWFGAVEKLGLTNTVFGIILGSTFDWRDILCYALGCIVFASAEHLIPDTGK